MNETKKCPDGSVGIIFKNSKGQILLLERLTLPFSWAPPAGHRDGENPEVQAANEAREEVGLAVSKLSLILGPIEVKNPCKRGFNCHDWRIYEAVNWTGEPKSGEPKKIGELRWFEISEIQELVSGAQKPNSEGKMLPLDPAWKILFSRILTTTMNYARLLDR